MSMGIVGMSSIPEAMQRKLNTPPSDHHPACKCMRCTAHAQPAPVKEPVRRLRRPAAALAAPSTH